MKIPLEFKGFLFLNSLVLMTPSLVWALESEEFLRKLKGLGFIFVPMAIVVIIMVLSEKKRRKKLNSQQRKTAT